MTTVTSGAKISPSGDLSVATSRLPVGTIVDFPASEAKIPPSWLVCDGRSVSRTAYSDLFNAIGTIWGAGDGSTTFNVPDLRGFIIAGLDNMGGTNAGRLSSVGAQATTLSGYMGAQSHQLAIAELPAHQHLYAHGTVPVSGILAGPNYNTNNGANATSTDNPGGDAAHSNIQPTRVYNKIIRASLI